MLQRPSKKGHQSLTSKTERSLYSVIFLALRHPHPLFWWRTRLILLRGERPPRVGHQYYQTQTSCEPSKSVLLLYAAESMAIIKSSVLWSLVTLFSQCIMMHHRSSKPINLPLRRPLKQGTKYKVKVLLLLVHTYCNILKTVKKVFEHVHFLIEKKKKLKQRC